MTKVSYYSLLALLFFIPLENSIMISGVGTIARTIGAGVLLFFLAGVILGEIDLKIHYIHIYIILFVLLSLTTFYWAYDYELTLKRSYTYFQLLVMSMIIYNLSDQEDRVSKLLFAYLIGAFVLSLGIIWNYYKTTNIGYARFDAYNFNPNDIASIITIAVPFSFYLYSNAKNRNLKTICLAYFAVAPIVVLLTGSRAGFLKIAIAFIIISIYCIIKSRHRIFLVTCLILAVIGISFLPTASFDRVSTIGYELTQGGVSGRTGVWFDGLVVFTENPFLGIGAGNFSAIINYYFNYEMAPHNVYLAILVEQGIAGLIIFLALIINVILVIIRFPEKQKLLWINVFAVWFLTSITSNWEWKKETWLIIAILLAHSKLFSETPDKEMPPQTLARYNI